MSLTNCACCNKKISEDSTYCIYCGHPINEKNNELLFAYQYQGETINSPLFRDDAEKLDVLMKIKKVAVYDKTYIIKDFICNAHNETIYVILGDID